MSVADRLADGIAFGALWLLAQNLSTTAVAIAGFGAIVLAGLFVQPIVSQVQPYIDRMFFRERIDRLNGISRISEIGNDIANLKALTASLANTMRLGSQSDWLTLLLPDTTDRFFTTVADCGSTSRRIGQNF